MGGYSLLNFTLRVTIVGIHFKLKVIIHNAGGYKVTIYYDRLQITNDNSNGIFNENALIGPG